MLGHGFYNKHSHEQGKANTSGLPLLVDAVKANDWTTLFQTVFFSPESYLVGERDVFCFASGTSIYRQIFPPNHIALGYSAITTRWLSRKPCNIPNEIWSVRATGNVHDTWAKQAKADWNAFLQYRALEMQPSARLVIIASGADGRGNSGAEGLIDLANQTLQELVKNGTLSPDEYEQMDIPTYYRTAQEWKEPLTPGSDLVDASGLSLVHFEERVLSDTYFEQYQQNRDRRRSQKLTPGSLRQRSNRAFSSVCSIAGRRRAGKR